MKHSKNIKKFLKKYQLPMIVTMIFAVSVVCFMFYRHSQLDSLPVELVDGSFPQQSDIRLISKDEAADIQSHEDTLLTPGVPAGGSSPAPGSPASGNQTGSGGNGTNFAANVTSIRYLGSSRLSGGPATCSRKHEFEAIVSSRGQPGEVNYYWERSDGTTSPVEVLKTGSGRNHYSIIHGWNITTHIAGRHNGWARLVITRPSGSVSRQAEFTHTCLGL